MAEIHWSKIIVNFITIEITYSDGARQGWDYDCIQYPSFEAMKMNMANDFNSPREDWNSLMVFGHRNDVSTSIELDDFTLRGEEFAEYILNNLGESLWQQAVIS